MYGYDESKLTDIEAIKNEFFYNTVLTKAKTVFLDTKKTKKGIKSFFSKNSENIFQTNKRVTY